MHRFVPPPLVGLITALAIYTLASVAPSLAIEIPIKHYLVTAFAIAGLALDGSAIFAFFKARTTVNPLTPDKATELVTEGFYKVTRNPMYLGMLCLLVALALWFSNPLGILPIVLFVWFLTAFQIKAEEKALQARFGEAYSTYCEKVRRWI